MKVFVILALVGAVRAAPNPQAPPSGTVPASAPVSGPVSVPVWPIRPYSYSYDVSDPLTNNFQNKAEIKTATGDVFGSYSVLMPDNYIYTTTYNVTGNSGYLARLVKTLSQVNAAISATPAGPSVVRVIVNPAAGVAPSPPVAVNPPVSVAVAPRPAAAVVNPRPDVAVNPGPDVAVNRIGKAFTGPVVTSGVGPVFTGPVGNNGEPVVIGRPVTVTGPVV